MILPHDTLKYEKNGARHSGLSNNNFKCFSKNPNDSKFDGVFM